VIGFDMMAANHPGTMLGGCAVLLFTKMPRRVAMPAESKPWRDAAARQP
jgi:hypothetical protein